MRISFDPAKNERNIRVRGLRFDAVAGFDFKRALYAIDDRRDYGETRYVALEMRGDRLHILCFVENEDGIRIISVRKANAREVRRHATTQITD